MSLLAMFTNYKYNWLLYFQFGRLVAIRDTIEIISLIIEQLEKILGLSK